MKKQGKKRWRKGLVNLIRREIDRQEVDAYTNLALAPTGESPVAQQNSLNTRRCGGIGIHFALKTQRLLDCEFESRHRHLIKTL